MTVNKFGFYLLSALLLLATAGFLRARVDVANARMDAAIDCAVDTALAAPSFGELQRSDALPVRSIEWHYVDNAGEVWNLSEMHFSAPAKPLTIADVPPVLEWRSIPADGKDHQIFLGWRRGVLNFDPELRGEMFDNDTIGTARHPVGPVEGGVHAVYVRPDVEINIVGPGAEGKPPKHSYCIDGDLLRQVK